MENVRMLNAKMFQFLTIIMVISFATFLLFIPFYLSKSLQIEIPKGVNYAIIFVYGYLVVKIINSVFETAATYNSNNSSEEINNTYPDEMYREVEKKVYDNFLETLYNSKKR
jgi:hypothetical protein